MKVNMDDLLLAGLLDNDDELILLSQVCSGSDVPSFEKARPRSSRYNFASKNKK